MNYPIDIINMLKNGSNPQQIVLSMLPEEQMANPVIKNLVQLAQNNDTQSLEQFARNMFQEKGLDFDQEFNSFKQRFGIK